MKLYISIKSIATKFIENDKWQPRFPSLTLLAMKIIDVLISSITKCDQNCLISMSSPGSSIQNWLELKYEMDLNSIFIPPNPQSKFIHEQRMNSTKNLAIFCSVICIGFVLRCKCETIRHLAKQHLRYSNLQKRRNLIQLYCFPPKYW